MLSVDTNVLVHALNRDAPYHQKAAAFLKSHQSDEDLRICELVLVELYVLLRNPAIFRRPLPAGEAAQVCHQFRANPAWGLLDYPGPNARIMDEVWAEVSRPDFPRRRIFDARLAHTLRHYGVTELATQNVRDFGHYGFHRVFDPTA